MTANTVLPAVMLTCCTPMSIDCYADLGSNTIRNNLKYSRAWLSLSDTMEQLESPPKLKTLGRQKKSKKKVKC
jgi:hypothetical protein